VRENTSEDCQFLLVTGQLPLRDAWSEWFPVLTERHSQATLFGYEWVNDGQFGTRVDDYKTLQACAYQDTACLEGWNQVSNTPFTYVFLWNRTDAMRYPLSVHMQQNPDYEPVFENEQTLVFRKVK